MTVRSRFRNQRFLFHRGNKGSHVMRNSPNQKGKVVHDGIKSKINENGPKNVNELKLRFHGTNGHIVVSIFKVESILK